MIVRMAVVVLAPLVPEQLQCTVRNHLVGIHVRRRTGAALHHVDHEMLVQPALLDLAAGIDNSPCRRTVQQSQIAVRPRRGFLDHRQRANQFGVKMKTHATDVEILDRAHSLYSEIILDRYVFLAEQIVLATKPAGKRTNCNIHNGIGFDPLQI